MLKTRDGPKFKEDGRLILLDNLHETEGFAKELKFYEFMDAQLASNCKCSHLMFNGSKHALHERP